ncbi:MAG: [Fe-Fe] hydrogenase large subunit C-terminal domain-containing protein [Bacillota bacterium]|nr:[Fe-Fe] hydrogenase large subunit C-terminal domain-containing protein [Bacillota bacterium]
MSVIETIEAKCKDCYKCLRSCPVKAIRMERGDAPHELHARVAEERCIFDGTCVLICPQKAKRVASDLDRLRSLIAGGAKVAASLAPSFPSAFPDVDPLVIPAALRLLGFQIVQETAVGAELVSAEHARLFRETGGPLISSSCPAVVNLIERHYPEAITYLAPVVSPMVAHGRFLKQLVPDVKVAFIGPCIAKHEERRVPGLDDAVDFVLTFDELSGLFKREGIDLSQVAPGDFDGPTPDLARLFPVGGGMLKASLLSTDMLDCEVVSVSGVDNCREVLRWFSESARRAAGRRGRGGEGGSGCHDDGGGGDNGAAASTASRLPRLVEMLACEGGCIGGPMNSTCEDVYTRRARVLAYAKSRAGLGQRHDSDHNRITLPRHLLQRSYRNLRPETPVPEEDAIRAVLAKTGKYGPEDELNCGACGYDSCRDKAVAVLQGMADPEMCIPYMRERAESMANLFVASAPYGIIVVDEDEVIRDLNAAAERMFRRARHEAVGGKLATLMDPSSFRQVLASKTPVQVEVAYPELGLVTRQTIFYEPEERLAMGVIADITEEKRQAAHLQKLRAETLEKAQGVIDKQMEVAQKIAGLLGETTAETKVLLTRLMNIFREEGRQNGGPPH